jgi:cold shock protein
MCQVFGKVKWFDVSKGFGFIETELGDVLIHISILREGNIEKIFEGDTLEVEAICSLGKLRATKIVRLEERDKQLSLPLTIKTIKKVEGTALDWQIAKLKWFNQLRGFGFFLTDKGDAFIHMETIRTSGIIRIQSDEFYMIKYGQSKSGLVVSEIRPTTR